MRRIFATSTFSLAFIFSASHALAEGEERFRIVSALEKEHFVAFDQELSAQSSTDGLYIVFKNRKNPNISDVFQIHVSPTGECSVLHLPSKNDDNGSCDIGNTFLNIDYTEGGPVSLKYRLLSPDAIDLNFSFLFKTYFILRRESVADADVLETEYLERKNRDDAASTESLDKYIAQKRNSEAQAFESRNSTPTSTTPIGRFSYCYSMAGGARTSYVSTIFPFPTGVSVAAQVNAFRAYTQSRYNDHNVNITCSFENSRGAAMTRRDQWVTTLRSQSNVVLTEWQYGGGE